MRAEDAADGDQVLGLAAVVELVHQRPAELLQQVAEAVPAAEVGVRVEQVGDLGEHLHVLEHLVADAGPLDLDHDLAAVAERGPVHLPERGRGERAVVEGREDLGEPDAELGADDLLDLLERERLDLVLEPGQRLDVRRREQVDAGGHQLAELHEGRAHRLEVVGEPGRGLGVALLERLVGEDGVDPGGAHEIPPPVPGEEGRDLAVALQVTGPDLGCHGASRLAARGGVRPGRGRGGRLVYRSVIRGSPFSRPVPLMEQAPLRGVPPL